MIACVYISVGAFQQIRLYSHIQKSERHYSQCYQHGTAFHGALFSSDLHVSLYNAYNEHPLRGLTVGEIAENSLISRARERKVTRSFGTTALRLPSSDSELECAQSWPSMRKLSHHQVRQQRPSDIKPRSKNI